MSDKRRRPALRPDRFDAAAFLRDTWQKRPLLIRNPWPEWINPIEPDELAGLACEDGVEARLIEQARTRTKIEPRVEQGPFAEARFGRLKKSPWALLVQAVDQHVPNVAALLEAFRFVPNWRIDDVMVSYATYGGGVGAHFDQYDVFLVQGLGRRRWQVGQLCDGNTPLLPHDELRLLADFQPTEEWVLEPGDILYVPPRVAHNGIALGDDCMTYSIGFRSPSRAELIAHWCDHLLAETADDDRYADPDLTAQANPGEIAAPALDRLRAMVAERLGDRDAFARWFGQYTSTRKYPDIDWTPEQPIDAAALRDCLAQDVILYRNPASRFAFIRQGAETLLFVDGACIACAGDTAAFAERLCASDRTEVGRDMPSATVLDLIGRLFNAGSLAIEERG